MLPCVQLPSINATWDVVLMEGKYGSTGQQDT